MLKECCANRQANSCWARQSVEIMALQLINLDLSSAQGIKENNLAPNEGQSASIMALLFIKLDLLSAQGIKENFLAPLDVQRVVGRAQVYRLWRSNSSIWICQVFFILMALLKVERVAKHLQVQ